MPASRSNRPGNSPTRYLVEMVDGRRIVLEMQQIREDDEGQNTLTIEPLASGAMPVGRPADERMAPWYPAHHITLHIAD
jgi:hypothetical protein